MKINIKALLLSLAIPLAVGGIAGWLSMDGMRQFETLQKPPLSPPAWLFPVVWTLLYLLMGVASYLVYQSGASPEQKKNALTVYGIQLAVNFLWPIFFFRFQNRLFAFFWLILLWLLILFTILLFYRLRKASAFLLLPYLLWVSFAGYLNLSIYLLNR